MEFSKDGYKLACIIYKEYLNKRKNGVSKLESKYFGYNFYKDIPELKSENEDDIDATLSELNHAGFLEKYVDGGFKILDEGIIYMENRFKNGIGELIDIISKFI